LKELTRTQFSIALSEKTLDDYKILPKSEKGQFLTASIEVGNILGTDVCKMIIKAKENGWTLNRDTLLEIFTYSRNDFKETENVRQPSAEITTKTTEEPIEKKTKKISISK
jgi:hypothetical protein